jgi:Family of unknown function (DUF6491)
MRRMLPMVVAVLGLAFAMPQVLADPAMPPSTKGPQCFSVRSFENWKALDSKTLYIRTTQRRYYRLDLAASCPRVTAPSVHLITKWRGSNWVCSALDWDLRVSDDPTRGFESACIVKSMTPLTDAEASAIPRKFKP